MKRTKDDARRLAGTLDRYKDDPAALAKLAAILNYHEPQLKDDITSLYDYMQAADNDE